MMQTKRIDLPRLAKHGEAILILNALIIDLKLNMAGRQPVEEIYSETRMQELEYAIRDIERCSEPMIRY